MNLQAIYFWTLCGAISYLLGSLPVGFLLARARGIDIRKVGSGNIGATNVFRSVSKPLGVLSFAVDFAKGWCGVCLVPLLVGKVLGIEAAGKGAALFSGVMAVVGHNWTCFLRFKGGKGVATSAGMLLGLSPIAVGIGLAAWVVVFVTMRYVSLASITAAVVLGGVVWPLHLRAEGGWFPSVLTLLALLVVWKHRSNIARLRSGTEMRFSFRKSRE